ncbi:hypothetical protein [Streptomyces lydicus]|uniref:hypothetical protein n=1 Tax=Streptomyces lydicus TaxID=47763 RepID=UPI0037BC1ACE
MPEYTNRLVPTGTCWCGCEGEAGIGRFFIQGHDKIAESALVATEYEGSIARLLEQHKFGPTESVRAAAVARGGWINCPISGCRYTGAPASVRKHAKLPHTTEQ